MRIAVAADHAGFALKQELAPKLEAAGHQTVDCGAYSADSCDYPDLAAPVALGVSRGEFDRGILICSTGIGMAIAANKIAGVRAAPAECEDEVRLARGHNDVNVLTIGAKYLDAKRAMELIEVFLSAGFEAGRHARRVAKIAALDRA